MGYGMRDGQIYIRDNVACRGGIHMKEFRQMRPVLVIGKNAGSFLGEYMAGGTIVLLGLDEKGRKAFRHSLRIRYARRQNLCPWNIS